MEGSTNDLASTCDKNFKLVVTIVTQKNFFVSHLRHFVKLRSAIAEKFGNQVDVNHEDCATNAGFSVYLRQAAPQETAPQSSTEHKGKVWGQLLFTKLREGYFPRVEDLLPLIEQAQGNMQTIVERELDKVNCTFIYSGQSPEYAYIFRKLVNDATSELTDNVKFDVQSVTAPGVLEIWINGQLIYSLWSCRDLPVLHDVIGELTKASMGQPINSMPKLR